MEAYPSFGYGIKRLRKALDLTQEALAHCDKGGLELRGRGHSGRPIKVDHRRGGAPSAKHHSHTSEPTRTPLSNQGTQAVAGNAGWSDIAVSALLQSPTGGTIGVHFGYVDKDNYYCFSMDSNESYRRLMRNVAGAFQTLWEDTIPYDAGRTHEFTVVAAGGALRWYINGVPVFVVEDSNVPTGGIGLYCWANNDARFSQVRVFAAEDVYDNWQLDEPFEFLVPCRWTFADVGDQDGPSQWTVAGGKMQQTSNIHGGDPAAHEPDKPGTCALVGDAAWSDYRLTVRLRSDSIAGAIGAFFRYQDKDNYYRFSMDHQGRYRCLVKKTAGKVTVLLEDAIQYIVGREYVLTIDCLGERLIGYLDGIPLFTCEDNAHAAGQVGLYCWANTGASFSEVRVAEPVWLTYYTFGKEERLPSGTRVRVRAGNVKDAPLEEQGVVQRFIASLGELGQLRLPSDGTDLRLVMGGMVGHMRRFLPDNDYLSVNMHVLRKVDGTAFLIATQSGSELTVGQYRLKMIYHRRANLTANPTSQIFSEAGNSDPEVVTLDIPW